MGDQTKEICWKTFKLFFILSRTKNQLQIFYVRNQTTNVKWFIEEGGKIMSNENGQKLSIEQQLKRKTKKSLQLLMQP